METKEEMESSVGLSRPVKDATAVTAGAAAEAGSVDTVCKYCGEDFKLYRTLKHHLRAESSCSHKPFTCRDCALGFSTKANCLRHIQKQHAPVAGVSVESRMTVNEVLLAAQQKAATTGLSGLAGLRKRGLEAGEDQPSKVRRLDMTSTVNGSQQLKWELVDFSASDEPLDFSLKTMESRSHDIVPVSAASADDEPMDLSIGSAARSQSRLATDPDTSEFECSSPISLVVASRRSSPTSHSAASASESAISCNWNVTKAPRPYQCTHCHAVFVHRSKVQRRSLFFLLSCFLIFLFCF